MTPEERIILGAYWELMQRESKGRLVRGPSAVRLAKHIRGFPKVNTPLPPARPMNETLQRLYRIAQRRLNKATQGKDRSSEEQWLRAFCGDIKDSVEGK